ncbi:MAG: glycosyltransferase family 4 protein [Candidatus Omnitrophica bacterium]|nr:glycosyltransferase family 4 protein [Candidatus Omnitrophota bacterium]
MKIAMLGTRGIPARYGGIETHLEELSSRLVLQGHQVIVYCRRPYSDCNQKFYKGVRLIHLPTIRNKYLDNIVHTFLSTLDVLKRKVDLVHFHGIGPSILVFIPRLFGIKTILTVHSLDWRHKKWGRLARLFLKTAEFIGVRLSHTVIVVPEELKAYVEEKHGRSAEYIPNGIKTPIERKPEFLRERGLREGNYVLTVGRIIPGKGIEYLLEAAKRFNIEMKVVVVGGSSYTEDYFQSLKKRANGNVLFLGKVYGRALEELYSNAYLYVTASETEGMSISLLEAMSYGRCVVASNIEANQKILKDSGFYFYNKDPLDLAQLLKVLAQDKDLVNTFGLKARQNLNGLYDWDKIALRTKKVYSSFGPRQEDKRLKPVLS